MGLGVVRTYLIPNRVGVVLDHLCLFLGPWNRWKRRKKNDYFFFSSLRTVNPFKPKTNLTAARAMGILNWNWSRKMLAFNIRIQCRNTKSITGIHIYWCSHVHSHRASPIWLSEGRLQITWEPTTGWMSTHERMLPSRFPQGPNQRPIKALFHRRMSQCQFFKNWQNQSHHFNVTAFFQASQTQALLNSLRL